MGLSRWQSFMERGLRSYAKRRNNAADSSGVSRLSAAFHYGFVSPMMVAREVRICRDQVLREVPG